MGRYGLNGKRGSAARPTIFCPNAVFLVSDRTSCAISSSPLDARVLAVPDPLEANLRILAKAAGCRSGNESHSKCDPSRQATDAVSVPRCKGDFRESFWFDKVPHRDSLDDCTQCK